MQTRLFVDANVLVRCSVGHASNELTNARRRGVILATTVAQANETRKVLVSVFGIAQEDADREVDDILSALELYDHPTFADFEETARARMHYKNTRDWPILAAALATNSAIWTDDRDFFGVGARVWSTRNLKFMSSTGA